jgi:glucan phosphoethanolaminetransferase (alkaline phosphatase superfamily)
MFRAPWTAVLAILTIAILLLPDIFFGPMRWQVLRFYDGTAWASVIIIGSCVALMGSARCRVLAIALIAISQIIWLGVYAYFGSVLRPEQLMLLIGELPDTASGAMAESSRIIVPTVFVLACAGLLYLLHGTQFSSRFHRIPGAGVVLVLALVGVGIRWGYWKNQIVSFPGPNSSSVIATYHTAISAGRFSLAPPSTPPKHLPIRHQTFSFTKPSSEPVTVLVIMGESINPRRLSVLGAEHPTTPNLTSWLHAPPAGFELKAGFGFSMGVATLASLPSFLRVAPVPTEGMRTGANIFDLARSSGFKSAYLSAQRRHFLNTAGGAPGASMVETYDENASRIKEVGDDFMLPHLQAFADDDASRKFIFIHQRVNHSAYSDNCRHVAAETNYFSNLNRPGVTTREIDYDNGLRCWDRNVVSYIKKILDLPGAIYVFVTSDHNEFMGERGLWGHLHPHIENALVPYIMMTNRPKSRAAQLFDEMPVPSFFNLARSIASAMDVELHAPTFTKDRFYVNKTLPFGISGFMEAVKTGDWAFDVRSFDAHGAHRETMSVSLDDVASRTSDLREQMISQNSQPRPHNRRTETGALP